MYDIISHRLQLSQRFRDSPGFLALVPGPGRPYCTLIAIENDLDMEGEEEFLVSLEPSSISGTFTFSPNQMRVRILDTNIQGRLLELQPCVMLHIHYIHQLIFVTVFQVLCLGCMIPGSRCWNQFSKKFIIS